MAVDPAQRKKHLTVEYDPNIDIWTVSIESGFEQPRRVQRRKLNDALGELNRDSRINVSWAAKSIKDLLGVE